MRFLRLNHVIDFSKILKVSPVATSKCSIPILQKSVQVGNKNNNLTSNDGRKLHIIRKRDPKFPPFILESFSGKRLWMSKRFMILNAQIPNLKLMFLELRR